MRKLPILALLTVLFLWCVPAISHHGPGHHRGTCPGCGDTNRDDSRHCRNCDNTSATVTLNGTIEELTYPSGSGVNIVEVKLRTDSGAEWVRLAPAAFLKKSGVTLTEGDVITVKGLRVNGMNGDMTVAHELTKENQTVTLRDRGGRGRW